MAIDLGSRAYVGTFFSAMEQGFGLSWASKIGWLNPNSDQDSETYKWLGNVPALREWIGGRAAKGLRTEGITIVNKPFEATLEFYTEDLNRDKTGQVDLRIGELGTRASVDWEKKISTLVNNGGAATSGLAYDGQYFFDNDHVSGDSGTQTNLLTASDYGTLDVTTATAPTPDEAAKIILSLISHFYSLKDDQGELINGSAKKFAIMVAPALWGPFMTAASSINLTGGATNPVVSAISSQGYQVEIIPNGLLTSAGSLVYAFRTDAALKPFILQEESGIQIDNIGAGSEYEKLNRKQLFGVRSFRNAGFGLWQFALKATLS